MAWAADPASGQTGAFRIFEDRGLRVCHEYRSIFSGRRPAGGEKGKPLDPRDLIAGQGDSTVPELPAGVAGIRNARILLVEDNHLNQVVASEILMHAGLKVDLVANGEEAVRAVREGPGVYDAVLMDMRMPVMDGFEAIRIIREEFSEEDLPIISTTAGGLADERERCLAAGANDYLSKPFLVTDICAILIRWIPAAAREPAESTEPDENAGVNEGGNDPKGRANARLPAHIDGVDMNAGLARTMGNRELYASLLVEFAQFNETLGEDVARTVAEGDPERARFLVHALVSTAGNIGADELSAITGELEAAIVARSDRLPDLLKTFQTKLDGVVDAIRGADISAQSKATPRRKKSVPFDREEASRLLDVLADMLDDQDMAAQDHLDELAVMLGGRGQDETLERLRSRLAALEFSEAKNILERVRTDILA